MGGGGGAAVIIAHQLIMHLVAFDTRNCTIKAIAFRILESACAHQPHLTAVGAPHCVINLLNRNM